MLLRQLLVGNIPLCPRRVWTELPASSMSSGKGGKKKADDAGQRAMTEMIAPVPRPDRGNESPALGGDQRALGQAPSAEGGGKRQHTVTAMLHVLM